MIRPAALIASAILVEWSGEGGMDGAEGVGGEDWAAYVAKEVLRRFEAELGDDGGGVRCKGEPTSDSCLGNVWERNDGWLMDTCMSLASVFEGGVCDALA